MSHATGFCAGVYSPIAQILRSDLRIVGMDDRGHGTTKAPADPGRLKGWNIFAQDLERLFESLAPPVIALGHSRGAVASLLLAVRRPDLVRALILIDPTILPFHWMWLWYLAKKTGLAKHVPIAAKAYRRREIWPDRESILTAYRGKGPFRGWQDGFLEAYITYGTALTEDRRVRLCCKPDWEARCFAECPHDVWRYIPQLTLPILILYGERSDIFLPSAVNRFKGKVPKADFRRFDKTSHFVPMERPQETADAIRDFLTNKGLI
jgi:pimeloyl-ACP methyl ester carboxylesterase